MNTDHNKDILISDPVSHESFFPWFISLTGKCFYFGETNLAYLAVFNR